ncbi:MAG: 16S rRNA (guanine(527)-N(7))-methyltransferase RsmG [Gammaproteobacteria bacterium]
MIKRNEETVITAAIESQLSSGLEELGLSLSAEQQGKLLDYLALLMKWNKAFNLSGVRDAEQMLSRHILDSLTLVNYMQGTRILDVGTGPGLPGIPLAICYPDKQFGLLDSNGKKSRFVFQAKLQLGLSNIEAINARVESFQDDKPLDIIVSRAFATLEDMITVTRHLVVPGHTRLVAMKGLYPEEELAAIPDGFVMTKAERVSVPGYTGERHIIELEAKKAE